MDCDTVDFKHNCSNFDTSGDLCHLCQSLFSVDGLHQALDPSKGYLRYDLASLKERERDSCPLCRAILGRFNGSRLYRRFFREESVNVILRIQTQSKCNGLSRGSAGESPMHVLSISLHSLEFAEVVEDIRYELDIFAYEDDPAASWISSRPPELNVKSTKTTSKAKAMILDCQAHHVDCVAASPPRLPTRVIDVRESTLQTICLYTPDKSGEFD